MPITSINDYLNAGKQRLQIVKTQTRTSVAVNPFTVLDLGGQPGNGTLAGSSSANGVKPDDTTAGFPAINFSSGTSYISKIEYYSSVLSRLMLYDMLFKAGTYAYNSGTTNLSSQPDISSRCPDYTGGSTFGNGCEIWVEVSTAFATGNSWQIRVTYTNSAGTSGRTSIISSAAAAAALTLGKMFQIALQAGDTGVQKIESVIATNGGTAMTAGAVNVLIMRPLWFNRVAIANGGGINNLLDTGMIQIYNDSALYLIVQPDSTSTGLPYVTIEIANA